MFESSPNQEGREVSREEVVESLKQTPPDLSVLYRYMRDRESQVTNNKDNKEILQLNIDLANIYKDAGLLEVAQNAFNYAAEMAWQEKEDDLSEQLKAEAEKIQF